MNRSTLLIVICLISTAFLAGCHEPTPGGDMDGDDGGMDGDDGDGSTQDITLTVQDAPDSVTVGEAFNVTVSVTADGNVTTSHFGAHWSFNSTADRDDLTAQDFDGGSPHVTTSTDLGDTYTIEGWTFSEEHVGTIFFRAHVQTADGDFWSDEQTITVESA